MSEPEHMHRVVEPGRDNFTGYAAIKYAAINTPAATPPLQGSFG